MENNKAEFAAYLNMARQNAYITLLHISNLMGIIEEKNNKENQLWNMKVISMLQTGAKEKPEKIQKIIKLLHKHFPFLAPMIDQTLNSGNKHISPDTYYHILITLFRTLNIKRNEYTHAHLIDTELTSKTTINNSKEIAKWLKNVFDGARRVVKTRFGYTEKDLEFLTGNLRYHKEKIEGKYVSVTIKGKRIQVPAIHHVENDNYLYKLSRKDETLSTIGLYAMTCLFLQKKYAVIFADKISIPPTDNKKERKIIHEIFNIYRIRLPKERLESDRPAIALGLDMLNELEKCPSELFDTLSSKDQNKFRVKVEADGNTPYEQREEILLKRSKDRFPSLVMRYIDECNLFKTVRFQIALGNYRYEFYNKQCIDSSCEDRVRSLQKELNGFGRLQDIEKWRKEVWKPLIRPIDQVRKDEVNSSPYINDHHASYVFNNNRIGLAFYLKGRRNEMGGIEYPLFIKSDNGELCGGNKVKLPSGLYLPPIKENKAPCIKPICWLSTYELPALIFHLILSNFDNTKTENIIKLYVENYYRLFEDIINGNLTPIGEKYEEFVFDKYHISSKDIPEKLREYLKGEKVDINSRYLKLSKERILDMIHKTECRLNHFKREYDKIGKRDNKIGKKSYVDIRAGRLADFLARDIMFFKYYSQFDKVKVTGLNFQILQGVLALYNLSLNELHHLFVNAELINCDNPHPFILNVFANKPRSIYEFYKTYLEEKIKYLNNITDYKKCTFLYPDRKKWEERTDMYYKELCERYINNPIELPRNLFEDEIKKLLMDKHGDVFQNLDMNACNIAYLIVYYFKHVYNDQNQLFYFNYKRTYKYFNLLNNEVKRNKLKEKFYSVDELRELLSDKNYRDEITSIYIKGFKKTEEKEIAVRRLKKYEEDYRTNEKCIRRYKVQDILLFILSKNILINTLGKINLGEIKHYKLKDISLQQPTNILNLKIPFEIKLHFKDGTKKIIKQESLKLKNYGDFFKFLYDARITSLLPQIEHISIDRELLEKELEKYDNYRPLIFKLVHKFEQSIIEKNPRFKNERHQFKDLIDAHGKLSLEDKALLQKIRNAFSHNYYPTLEEIKKMNIPMVADNIEKIFFGLIGTN